jgi:hypothetical protein
MVPVDPYLEKTTVVWSPPYVENEIEPVVAAHVDEVELALVFVHPSTEAA